MRLRTLSIVGVMALISTLAGCSGGGARVQSDVTTTTKGQQLIDLQKARDSGAIDQKEYETLRKKVLKED
jgi:hypothetical protein